MIKKNLLVTMCISLSTVAMAQIGIGTNNPDQSSIMELSSSNKGFLPPRVALTSATDASTIPNPANGLVVFNTNANFSNVGLYLNLGTPTSPDWRFLQVQRPGGTTIEYTSLDLAPVFDMNLIPNNSGNWTEVPALRQNVSVSIGANIKTVMTGILNAQGSSGTIAQCDVIVKLTPGSTALPSTLSGAAAGPRDSFGLISNNGNGQTVSINVAKSTVATNQNYVIQVYVFRGNSPSNLPSYNLTPFYINTLATK
ncbi:hypothetical protein ASG22_05680 [Chryseobacterium sp. Leaf405]|uniref:hypothetical protein n=1 Tax=Chryseobacterium sp. Leaf405 TaxID=1736367 RepID=UPI0006F6FFB3|nr:hypothetical protein [Chryseobacterium sp. Leaf405]KQT26159.1 hypothetical protein ASG22_05680 [Chryseobacterium sp. Leaf405]